MLRYDTNLLKSLCETYELHRGSISDCNCETKGTGRITELCNRSGVLKLSRVLGQRIRVLKKVGCTAHITTIYVDKRQRKVLVGSLQVTSSVRFFFKMAQKDFGNSKKVIFFAQKNGG